MNIFEDLVINSDDYFLTGSRALGVEKSDSDYDYVVLIQYRHIILAYLDQLKIKYEFSNYNGGFKFFVDGKIYNIITCISIEFYAWREALAILKLLMNIDKQYQKAIENKMTRYCVYESLRALIKTILSKNSSS